MDNGRKRGFASMDPERQRELASKGGRAAHAKGTAHKWSRDQARIAGKKGGVVVSRDRAHMSAIGKEGGEARGRVTAVSRHEIEKRTRSSRRFVERAAKVSVVRDLDALETRGRHAEDGLRDERRMERS